MGSGEETLPTMASLTDMTLQDQQWVNGQHWQPQWNAIKYKGGVVGSRKRNYGERSGTLSHVLIDPGAYLCLLGEFSLNILELGHMINL